MTTPPRTIAIVQARMGSTRLPHKVMAPIGDTPMIGVLLQRLSKARRVDQIMVATSDAPINDPLAAYVETRGLSCFRGSENDVLARYHQAALMAGATAEDAIIRITGDCPLVEAALVDQMVALFAKSGADYASNTSPPSYPDGLDIEVFRFAALEQAAQQATSPREREHVTPFLREQPQFQKATLQADADHSALRWTVDEQADLDVVRNVFAHFQPELHFSWQAVLELQKNQPDLFTANHALKRNEGTSMNTGAKLYKRAKRLIPGGNMLLSKRPEMFLPDLWPSYFSRAKGCRVWDLDDNEYIDMSIMGIGTNILGYGHPEVNEAVAKTVEAGNMSTLNCPEEVYLAEELVRRHPWADMVRFARTGGEANAVAVRIARAASGKDNIAICGYHGWHDWYLSANLNKDDSLSGHLLPGLDPKGVPKALLDTVFPFEYNDFEGLKQLVEAKDIGVIKMEVSRNFGPEDGFLEKVRALATQKGIVLVFDECTSGFRQTDGGLHKLYGVEPDMALFGKALGNGYAITATIGRREVMEAAQNTFISSTFWTERIGPTAGLATLKVMSREKSWEQITETGLGIRRRWQALADSHGLEISHWGLPSLTGFSFAAENALAYKTLLTQEMLAKGYLASNSVYVCTAHTPEIVDGYFEALNEIFATIRDCEDGKDVFSLLKGPVCHAGFKRLN